VQEAESDAMQVRASRMDYLADVLGAGAFACLLACLLALLHYLEQSFFCSVFVVL